MYESIQLRFPSPLRSPFFTSHPHPSLREKTSTASLPSVIHRITAIIIFLSLGNKYSMQVLLLPMKLSCSPSPPNPGALLSPPSTFLINDHNVFGFIYDNMHIVLFNTIFSVVLYHVLRQLCLRINILTMFISCA